MRNKILILIFLFSSPVLFAQQFVVDSLTTIALKYQEKGNPEIAAHAFIDLALYYSEETQYPQAMEAIDKALLLIPSNNIEQLGHAKSIKGHLSFNILKNINESKILLEEALNLLSKYPKSKNYAFAHLKYGETFYDKGDHEVAIPYLKKALEIYQPKDWKAKAQVHYLLGHSYRFMGDYDLALEKFRTVLSLLDNQEKDFKFLSKTYQAMGSVFHDLKDYDQAILNYQKALENARKGNLKRIEATTLSNIGGIYANQGDTKKSGEVLRQALAIHESLKDSAQIAYTLFVLNEQFVIEGEFEKALSSARRLITYYESVPNKKTILSYVYLHASSYASELNNPNLAKEYAQKCLDLSKKMRSKELIKYAYETLYDIEKHQGNFDEALMYHENYFLMHDSIYTENTQKAAEEEKVKQQVEAETEAREKAELKATTLTMRNRFFGAVAGSSLLLLLMGMYAYRQVRNSKQKIESQNLQLQQLNTTKDKFFGIIAHDIRSPIVALDGVGEQMEFYLKQNKPEKLEHLAGRIDSTAKRLNSLLDNLLNWALLQQGVIPYHPKELNVKETANSIFQMFQDSADAKNITLHLQIEKDIKVYADESALNTILRNLVSNAIKFTPAGGTVSLSMETTNDKVFINVNDTGTGISAEKLSKLFSLEKTSEKGTAGERGTGLGLTLVKELAELNNGSINVNSVLEKGSSFKVGLPMVE